MPSIMAQAEHLRAVADESEAAVSRVKHEIAELAQEYGALKEGLSVFRVS